MISYNSKTLLKDGKPWMPTMGEMQYSRTERRYWKETLYKMKAAGVGIVSTYVIWIHHEEIEGKYDFRGNKNLRHFLQTAKECGMYVFLRPGPWIHGEVRNGGFPDWLLEKGFQTRSNDQRYFAEVEKYLKRLYLEVDGYMYAQGGPVIGVQIENEFGAALRSFGYEEEEKHFYMLEKIVKDTGFDVPLYTATGWGNSHTGTCIPVWGGYCDAPWNPGYQPNKPNPNYLFRKNQNDSQIASDSGDHTGYANTDGVYPYLTAELGGGIHCTQHRRPIATAKDIGAMSITRLGSGANLLGYYIFCGGKNPIGALTTLQEYKDYEMTQRFWTGYSCDMPMIDYDFQAPISNCQTIKPSYKEVKKISMFIKDFGELLSPMHTCIPNTNPTDPADTESLRYAFRTNGKCGFLFINNYQRGLNMSDKVIERLTLPVADSEIVFTNLSVKNKEYYIYPFHMRIGNGILKTAKAQPLCVLNDKDYVFFTDDDPAYEIEGDLGDYNIITLTSDEAANAYKIHTDQDYLFISDGVVLQTDKGISMIGENISEFKTYPAFAKNSSGADGIFTLYQNRIHRYEVNTEFVQTENGGIIHIDYPPCINNEDILLNIDYIGDKGCLYMDGELVIDQYCNGTGLRVNLSSLDYPSKLEFEITPLKEDAPVYMEVPVAYTNGTAAYVNCVSAFVQYKINMPTCNAEAAI